MKNTKELRAFLTEQMTGVAAGTVSTERAKSIANVAQQIYNTLNIEVKVAMARIRLGGQEIGPVEFEDRDPHQP